MPDFGIFRGFNDKLFGNKLYAGQLPTQLGLIGSVSFGFDTDALAFFNRVTTAGGTLSATEQLAIDTLVKKMKLDGIWAKMKAIYPMVGASSAACSQNLKSSSFTGTFNGGWTFASNGVTPNGSNAFMNTGLNAFAELQLNSVHFSNYLPNFTTTDGVDIGVIVSSDGLYAAYNAFGGLSLIRTNDQENTFSTGQGTANGFRLVTRTASNLSKSYVNNTNTYTSSEPSNAVPNENIYLGARNSSGAAANFSNRRQSFASIGDGLTDTEASNFYTAVQAFQTTLSRNV